MKSLSKFRLISCSYQCVNSSILLNPVSQPLRSVSDFHHCRRDRARAIVLADAFFVPSSLPPHLSPAGLPLPCLPPALPSENVSFYRPQLRRWSRRGRSCRGCDCVVLCRGRVRSSRRRSWSLISSSHRESVITDTPTLEAHHPAITFFRSRLRARGEDDGETHQSAGGC